MNKDNKQFKEAKELWGKSRARYVDKKTLEPTVSKGKSYIGNRGLSITLIRLGALTNQIFVMLTIFAVFWGIFWIKIVIDFYQLIKQLKKQNKVKNL